MMHDGFYGRVKVQKRMRYGKKRNKAGYTATLVACGWAGAMIEKVTGAFGQEQ